jgi:large subunit ribosomal protein L35
MAKGKSRSKTRKAVAKRFKITANGKVKAASAGRRHLAGSKNRKRKRQLAKSKVVDERDHGRIKQNLLFA